MESDSIEILDINGDQVDLTIEQNEFLNQLKSKCPITRRSIIYCVNVYKRLITEYPNKCVHKSASLLATSCDFTLSEQKKWIDMGLEYDLCIVFDRC